MYWIQEHPGDEHRRKPAPQQSLYINNSSRHSVVEQCHEFMVRRHSSLRQHLLVSRNSAVDFRFLREWMYYGNRLSTCRIALPCPILRSLTPLLEASRIHD
uniref:Uncharacterized protein n=1 Tax=Opuntia streptacantha TaxID=393608 RepID=A0A7C9F2H6_OPUST